MKKKLLLIFILINSLSFSQQVVKRITDSPSLTIVELFAIRNGTSLPNTTGNSNFNSGQSSNKGYALVYNPSIGSTYTQNIFPNGSTTYSNIQIGNGTFVFDYVGLSNNLNFLADDGSGALLPLIITQEDGYADSTQDNNTITDLLSTKWYLPKTLTDGNPIPTGLIVKCSSRLGKDNNSGATAIIRMQVIFSFNGTTWIPILTDWLGVTPPALEEIDNNGQLLSIKEYTNNSKINVYPNPTNNFITIQNLDNVIRNFEYKILDFTGKIITKNYSKFNEQISIESLTSGNYIIQIETENGQKLIKKLIKN